MEDMKAIIHELQPLNASLPNDQTPLKASLQNIVVHQGGGGVGKDGKSAYEIAVDNGFEGNETEWLASLHGKDGKDGVDGKDGYTPIKGVDYFDGKDGEDGYTPIKGVDYFDGKDGINGKDGVDGKDGSNGKDGYSPVRGVDYWTDTDRAEIKSYVDEAILGGAW